MAEKCANVYLSLMKDEKLKIKIKCQSQIMHFEDLLLWEQFFCRKKRHLSNVQSVYGERDLKGKKEC